jgi:hypothetical protein
LGYGLTPFGGLGPRHPPLPRCELDDDRIVVDAKFPAMPTNQCFCKIIFDGAAVGINRQ